MGTEHVEYYREMETRAEECWAFLEAWRQGVPLGGLQAALWQVEEVSGQEVVVVQEDLFELGVRRPGKSSAFTCMTRLRLGPRMPVCACAYDVVRGSVNP